MFINEYGSRDDPTVILLAPMMVSGSDLYNLMKPCFRRNYHIVAPDQGGHGQAGGYHSTDEEYQTLRSFLLEIGCTEIALVYGASLGVAVGWRLFFDPAFRIARAWFDGVALARNARFAEWFMKRMFLFAAVEACDRDFPGEDILRLGDALMVSKIRRLSRVVNAPKLVNKRWVQRFVGRMYGGYIRKCDARDWGNTWTMEVNPYGHIEGIAWRFTSCPLAEFAREHDLLPWAKYLCQMDHRMAEAAGCRLIRRHTIVAGDDECDYWIVGEDK